MKGYRWQIGDTDTSRPLLQRLRELRGLGEDGPHQIHDPMLMRDMDRACERLQQALARRERIFLFGDYDADGVTSTALLASWLRSLKHPLTTRLPHRLHDGYGLQVKHVDEALAAGAGLLITVDNGISAIEAVTHARERDLDVLILDHHELTGELPPANAVLDPKRPDCDYPFKGLCAAGVAFKLLQAMQAADRVSYLDLVAIGTIADMVPLLDENRMLVRRGLRSLAETQRPGLRALMDVCPPNRKGIDGRYVGWQLAPRINCAGRLDSASRALDLLLCDQEEQARGLAQGLDELNQRRQATQQQAVRASLGQLGDNTDERRLLAVQDETWHPGIIGLIAGRLCNQFHLPSLALAPSGTEGLWRGSARSPEGFDITAAISSQRELLIEFGGHSQAAGLSVTQDRLPELLRALDMQVREGLSEDWRPLLHIDALLNPSAIELSLLRDISLLEPFGMGNQAPLFMVPECRVTRRFSLSGGRHHKYWLDTDGQKLEAVWWDSGKAGADIAYGDCLDLACELAHDTWNGADQVQLVLRDTRPSAGGC